MKDRIRELRRVKASELQAHPQNWRLHPPRQHEALRAILAEVGFAAALLVRELDDGSLQIIDGHLRAELTPDELVPVLVLDVSADEAARLLATHDAISTLALPDAAQLDRLREQCNFASPVLDELLQRFGDRLETPNQQRDEHSAAPAPARNAPLQLGASYQVVASCESEEQQRALYERLTAEGFKCRVLVL
jgi:ParB-like chromosome segregation protein Spo0J